MRVKNIKKIFIAILILFGTSLCWCNTKVVSAATDKGIDPYVYIPVKNISEDKNLINEVGNNIYDIIFKIGVIVSVLCIIIIGILTIIGSAQEKADYKKQLIPVVLGILILSFSTTIITVIARMVS